MVQKLLATSRRLLTLDKYGHLFPDDLDAVAAAFDAAAQITAGDLWRSPICEWRARLKWL